MEDNTNESENNSRELLRRLRISAIIILLMMIAAVVLIADGKMDVQSILQYVSENLILAVLLLWVFYGLKSFTVVVPLASLYVAGGLLFPPVVALLVNLVGLTITITLPYWVGRWIGTGGSGQISEKYPKLKTLIRFQQKNQFLVGLVLRIISILPGDIINLYFGMCRVKYSTFWLSAICGSLPALVTDTLIGASVVNKDYVLSVILILIRIVLAVVSVVVTWVTGRKQKE